MVVARNGVEAIIAAIATASLGAVFSCCAPEMGAFAIVSRFAPLEPVVLMCCLRAEPRDVGIALPDRVAEMAAQLLTLKIIIALDDGLAPDALKTPVHRFADIVARTDSATDNAWRRFPFNQPLFIMFSSGTTGAPKYIVHGAGGKTYLERVKLAVLWRQKTLGLAVYEASVPQLRSLEIPKTGKALFRSPVFKDNDLDRLYSELSLLPI